MTPRWDPGPPPVERQGAPDVDFAGPGGTDVHTFLVADIRGYTAFTQQRGDEEAGRLAARFARVARDVVEANQGRVLELRGDEAVSVFGSPRAAIRAAVALQGAFVDATIEDPALPLMVGIGIDAGEAVPVEGGFRGAALNVAARLCSLARAGEVLASGELVHLARRVEGVVYTDRGEASLKGFDKPLRVIAVCSSDRDAAVAIAPFVPPAASRRSSRRAWAAVAVVASLALVTALVAIPALTRHAGATSEIRPNSIGVLDVETGEVTATLGFESRPGSIAISADAVWVAHPDIDTVTRLDRNELEVVDTVPVGADPTAIAVGEDAVWIVESGGPSVSRISPDTNRVVDTIPVANGPVDVAIGEGSVWVANRFDGTVSRIDPKRDEVVEAIPVGLEPRGIAIGFGSVWVSLAGSNAVVRVDPETNSVTSSIGVGNAPGSLAVAGDRLWVANVLDDTVSSIDPEASRVSSVVEVGDGPSRIATLDGTVWVANEGDGTISSIGPGEASVRRFVVGSVPQAVAGVGADLWVSVRGTATSHRGGTLRVVQALGPESLDDTIAYDYLAWHVLHLIGDGLTGFKLVGGSDSGTLVPDLATSLPTPTDGGRTYTFQLRARLRYSNGEPVMATDFRRAIERGFLIGDPYIRGVYRGLFGRILGVKACGTHPAACDLSQGIVTDDEGGTVGFHLVAPDLELLDKLSMPFAYPVPASVPNEEQARSGIPGTGPYMLDAPMSREGLTLVRNPYFEMWSSEAQPGGNVDRIEWSFGVEPATQVDAVARGDADLAYDSVQSTGLLDELMVRYAAQVFASPLARTYFVVLNTNTPPFDDVDVRRAVNLAVDRARVAEIFGGARVALPTCQQLPPNFPGYEPYCPYTIHPGPNGSWTGPNFGKARRLVARSGTARMRVSLEYPPSFWDPEGAAFGDYFVALLRGLGYRASLRTLSTSRFYDADNEFQAALDAWNADYPAASNFIANRFTCDASLTPFSGVCDPEIDALVDRALRMQAEDPARAGTLWARIDRAIVDQAPYVWLVTPIRVDFVSARVGNYQSSLQWEVLLSQIWVR